VNQLNNQLSDELSLTDKILVRLYQKTQEVPHFYWRDFELAWIRHCVLEAELLLQTEEPRDDDEYYTLMYLMASMENSVKSKRLIGLAKLVKVRMELRVDPHVIDARLNMDPFLLNIAKRRIVGAGDDEYSGRRKSSERKRRNFRDEARSK